MPKDAGDRAVIMQMCWTASSRQIIGLFSHRFVGWPMNANMTAQLVTDALIMVIWRWGKPDALL